MHGVEKWQQLNCQVLFACIILHFKAVYSIRLLPVDNVNITLAPSDGHKFLFIVLNDASNVQTF